MALVDNIWPDVISFPRDIWFGWIESHIIYQKKKKKKEFKGQSRFANLYSAAIITYFTIIFLNWWYDCCDLTLYFSSLIIVRPFVIIHIKRPLKERKKKATESSISFINSNYMTNWILHHTKLADCKL